MVGDLPEYYFRLRENGASVFKIDGHNRQSRLEFQEIASLNLRNGKIKPHGDYILSPADQTAIQDWFTTYQAQTSARDLAQIQQCIESLNQASHWVQSRASAQTLAQVSDPLLLAMHDLRQAIVRKQSEALMKKAAPSTAL